jgi:hypothetical protein
MAIKQSLKEQEESKKTQLEEKEEEIKRLNDAGASLHISQPASQPRRARAFKAEERRNPHILICN